MKKHITRLLFAALLLLALCIGASARRRRGRAGRAARLPVGRLTAAPAR